MDSHAIENVGGRDRGRTGDLIVANDALSQLSYSPTSSTKSLTKDANVSNTPAGVRAMKNQRAPYWYRARQRYTAHAAIITARVPAISSLS